VQRQEQRQKQMRGFFASLRMTNLAGDGKSADEDKSCGDANLVGDGKSCGGDMSDVGGDESHSFANETDGPVWG
jgi:hypothetical protein